MNLCLKCNTVQFALVDKAYLKLWGVCWACDREEWRAGRISDKELEAREEKARVECI